MVPVSRRYRKELSREAQSGNTGLIRTKAGSPRIDKHLASATILYPQGAFTVRFTCMQCVGVAEHEFTGSLRHRHVDDERSNGYLDCRVIALAQGVSAGREKGPSRTRISATRDHAA